MGVRAHDFPQHFECISAQEKTRGCLKLSNALTKVKPAAPAKFRLNQHKSGIIYWKMYCKCVIFQEKHGILGLRGSSNTFHVR